MAKATYISESQAEDLERILGDYSTECQGIINTMGKHKSTLADLPVVPDALAKYILLIIQNVRYRPQYIGYTDGLLADMLSNAQIDIIGCLRYYDKSKAGKTGAFGYISGNCIQSFNWTLLKYKREQEDCPIDTNLAMIMDDEDPVVKYIDYDLENIVVDSKYKKYLKAERLPQIPLHVERRISIERGLNDIKQRFVKKQGMTFEQYLLGVKDGSISRQRMSEIPEPYNQIWSTDYDPYQAWADKKAADRLKARQAKKAIKDAAPKKLVEENTRKRVERRAAAGLKARQERRAMKEASYQKMLAENTRQHIEAKAEKAINPKYIMDRTPRLAEPQPDHVGFGRPNNVLHLGVNSHTNRSEYNKKYYEQSEVHKNARIPKNVTVYNHSSGSTYWRATIMHKRKSYQKLFTHDQAGHDRAVEWVKTTKALLLNECNK